MKGQRLLSLDILRGITVAGMILVNNGWGESFEMLGHSKWNGMTPCDLVFPFFLFIMGISCYLSLVKSEFKPTPQVIRRIIKRTVLLFVIGLFINWFDHAIEGDLMCFGHLACSLPTPTSLRTRELVMHALPRQIREICLSRRRLRIQGESSLIQELLLRWNQTALLMRQFL